ncbi:hypothetical protein GOP47_0028788 [Adiantum capillus-veneris]|nr:hypothetical protein GOP47_0028788 [Adiantum capillus-veneris]
MLTEDLLVLFERVARLPTAYDFICSLLVCRRSKNSTHAKQLCTYFLHNDDFRANGDVGDYMMPTLVDCGSFDIAQQVFNELHQPNVNSWTALVHGFNDRGKFEQAHDVFHRMHAVHVRLSCYTFQAFVKTSVGLKNIEFGQELHTEIVKRGHDYNQIIGVTLIEMYVKCGSYAEAWEVLEKLPAHDVVSWNILITDYTDNGLGKEALHLFKLLQDTRLSPDVVSLIGSLKACSMVQDVNAGRDIHNFAIKLGFEGSVIISNTLVDMYMKCGSLEDAEKVFDVITIRTVVSWNALLAGYLEHGCEEALSCLDKMQSQGFSFTHVTVSCGLSCCSRLGDINSGHNLHADIVKLGLESHPSVGSSLVEMYMSIGWLDEGQQVFNTLRAHNVVSWTALITGYAEHGLIEEALDSFTTLYSENVSPDASLYVCLIECSCATRRTDKIFQVHCELAKDGLESDMRVASALVDTYATIGLPLEAQNVFADLPAWLALSCNVSASWYSKHNLGAENFLLQVEEMLLSGATFPSSMLVGSLKVCASVAAIDTGCNIHMRIVSLGLENDSSLGVALISMYVKCCCFAEAHHVHDDDLLMRSVSAWNAIILGHNEYSMAEQVLVCLERMQMEGVDLNEISCLCGLKACGNLGDIRKGLKLHAGILCEGLERDSLVGNSLVAMYAKLGLLAEAWEAFLELPVKDVVSWNSLMAGHTEHGLDEEVLSCWEKMQAEFISPNAISFVLSLKACSSLCRVDKGLLFHGEVIAKGLEGNTFIRKALLDMYAKSGLLAEALGTFNKESAQSLVLWNALVSGFACCGRCDLIRHVLERMHEEDVEPNKLTYLNVLTVCSHAGLLEEGQMCFQLLHTNYRFFLIHEHYNCIIDLLGRAGQLNTAVAVLELLPFQPDLVTWHVILGASRKWRNLELGRHAFESVVGLSSREIASYKLMLNMYAELEDDEQELIEM